jgi:tetratricopeptide (TPR) repeat protein
VTGALRALDDLLRATPNEPLLHADAGYYALLARRDADAVEHLSRARDLGSKSAVTFLNLGVALRRKGALAEAQAALARSLELRPSFRAPRLALAKVLCMQKRWAEAMPLFEELARSGGNAARAEVLLAQGRAYLAQHLTDKARAAFDKAVEWLPAQGEVRVAIARSYLDAGGAAHAASALAAARTAVELAPDLASAYVALGRAQEATGESDAAEESYLTALKLDADYHYARRRMLRIALARHDYDASRVQAERLLALAPERAEHHFLAGLVAAHAERFDDARAHYAAAISTAGGIYPEAYFNLGLLEKDADRLPEAVAAYKKAIEQKPDYLAAWNNLGLLYAADRHEEDAEAAYRKALAIDVRYWQAWANLGKLELRRKQYTQAIDAFERVLAIRPGAQEAALNLGVAYRRADKLDRALAVYQKLVGQEPKYVSAWFNYGIALAHAGKAGEARQAYERALSLDDTHVGALQNLGELLVKSGDLDGARARYEAALDQDPADRDARIALADVYRRKGDSAGCERVVIAVVGDGKSISNAVREQCRSRAEGQGLKL